MLAFLRRRLSPEVVGLAVLGVAVIGFAAFVCVSAVNYRPVISAATNLADIPPVPIAPLAPTPGTDSGNASLDESAPANPTWIQPSVEATPSAPAPASPRPAPASRPRFGDTAPLPPSRPADIGSGGVVRVPVSRPTGERRGGEAQGSPYLPPGRYDAFTAVYDLSAHTVYLPNGIRLEAHSGLGPLLDDPRYVSEKDRGPTPPHLYELTMREEMFHGVQALRLNPVGEGELFGRNGLLAHTYMLGPNGDSNGCVSFKDYDTFLAAFKNGQVKRLAVVPALEGSSVFAENLRH